jgi:hypothetical protein
MMHEMHHSVLLAQWSAEVRHTLTVVSHWVGTIGIARPSGPGGVGTKGMEEPIENPPRLRPNSETVRA